MRRLLLPLGLGIATSLVSWLGWHYGVVTLFHGTVTSRMPLPEDGKVLGGIYVNDYFDLSFPLPEGWTEGLQGPDPSDTGYYVLGELIPESEPSATILIAAQDMFFASKPPPYPPPQAGEGRVGVAELVRDFRQAMSEVDGMRIDREPTEVKVADRLLYRVDFSGVGLYRAAFTTEIRCHAVSFNLTARDPGLLADLAASVDKLSTAGKQESSSPVPFCVENYAVPESLLRRVEPVAVGPKFTPIPVRIIVDSDGGVKHVHVIRATDEQRKSIEDALRQWKFKPYRLNGRAVEIETGLVFRFTAAQN
jgi:Gram-negative bacterial TonB protein C-terminal